MLSNRLLSIIALTLCTFGLILLTPACKKNHTAKKMSAEAYNYLYAHTSGTISKSDPIRIRFTEDAIAQDAVNTEVPATLLHFKPNQKGTAVWEDTKTILFQPEGQWTSGTNYVAVLHLKKLFDDVPATAGQVEFDFKIIELAFDVALRRLQAIDLKNLELQELEGTLTLSDIANQAEIEKIITAKQGSRDLPVRWEHSGKKNTHTFLVSDIRRQATQDDKVQVYWNGKAIGVDDKGETVYTIPAMNNFKVMQVEPTQGKDQHLTLHFSDPLLPSQNLQGLVSLENYTGDLRFDIDGNMLHVYPTGRLVGEQKVIVRSGIQNSNKVKMRDQSTWTTVLQEVKPAVRLVGNGVVMPNSNGLIFPFESVSLNAVDVEIFKIFNNNILQFLQTNELDGSYDLQRVGRIIMQQKVSLKDLDPTARFYEWRRYALDLNQLIDTDPEAIYQVRIGFRPSYSTYYCDQADNNIENENMNSEYYDEDYYGEDYYDEDYTDGNDTKFKSIWGGYYGIMGYYQGYSWRQREDPCYPAYYNTDNFVRSNVIASDLGLIAKKGQDGSLTVAVTDLRTTDPLAGVEVAIYDYQNQLLRTTSSDQQGIITVDLEENPFVLVAKKGIQKGYLKLGDGNSLSLSKFNVAGTQTQKGLKGFIYGERGVWRPGDTIHLNFVLEDKADKLPSNYPIAFEFYDPRGQLQEKITTSENVSGIYPLTVSTRTDDPTGSWVAKVKAGGAQFSKTIKVETVKPNRLKLKLDLGEGDLATAPDGSYTGQLNVAWLHGAPAKGLKAKIESQVQDINTTFDKFQTYEFDDPTRKRNRIDPVTIFEDVVDQNGNATFSATLNNKNTAGKMRINYKVRAFEKGGDVSVNNVSKIYSPYTAYAGVRIPKNKYKQQRLDIGKPGNMEFVVVGADGNPVANRNISVGLYRVNWRWWWERGNDNISKYSTAVHTGAVQKDALVTNTNGQADWNITVDKWGRYLVRVCDQSTGHCSGSFFYAGYPWYDDDTADRDAASVLAFSSDKDKYDVGETIELQIPTGKAGRALVSIESGTKVIETHWIDTKEGENTFKFYATAKMTPTVYANVSLIQPHAQVENDLPIRMYGVIPISVEDPNTKLQPTIAMPEVLEPEQKVTVKIAEQDGKPMAYTIAMVDDGLLDLTNFKTPDPWNSFYAREALGVKTWDLYDQVLGAYAGEMGRVLSIGGDSEAEVSPDKQKANRFKPVVRHLGPFYLESRATATHEIDIPNYVGSVRTMVVAAQDGAYGNAEVTTPVRKPLMVLATLPRVIGPTEQLSLPVNVFAMEDKVKNVQVTVEEMSGLVNFVGENTQSVSFPRPDDKIVNFDLKIGEQVGIAKFKITATGGGEMATQEIEIDVRNPNPYIVDVQKMALEANKDWTVNFEPIGMRGTNKAMLEVSNIPPINLDKHLRYLLQYPYGCLEQTTSKGFPLLYVNRLIELDETQKAEVPKIVQATVDRLQRFQQGHGGFAYWPGRNYTNSWSTNYAGHFLIEAKALGYNVPDLMIERFIRYQKKIARQWDPELNDLGLYRYQSDLEQAYRLYVLAKANMPDYGAMNRMRGMEKLRSTAQWRLAAAYAIAGKPEVARQIVDGLSKNVEDYNEIGYTYGSGLRDRAMIVETLLLLDDKKGAMELIEVMSDQLSGGRWWSTQTLAYSLMAIGKFVGDHELSKDFNFAYQIGNTPAVNAGSSTPIMQIEVPAEAANSLKVSNLSNGMLFARLISSGQPLIGDQTAAANHLKVAVQFLNMNGKPLDPSNIEQGTDFIANVSVTNPGTKGMNYKEMALTQIFPSGWEIINSRMDDLDFDAAKSAPYTYQDIKDDRVDTFFNIPQKTTYTYRVQLNAAYPGNYYLPTTACQAMYDNTISARQPGQWVTVSAPQLN